MKWMSTLMITKCGEREFIVWVMQLKNFLLYYGEIERQNINQLLSVSFDLGISWQSINLYFELYALFVLLLSITAVVLHKTQFLLYFQYTCFEFSCLNGLVLLTFTLDVEV